MELKPWALAPPAAVPHAPAAPPCCHSLLPLSAARPPQTNAVATFNLLNEEGRKVVGALLPLGAEEEDAEVE